MALSKRACLQGVKERCGSCKTKKDVIKVKLVEEIRNNIWQRNFEALILAWYCFCGENVNGLLSGNLFQIKNNMAVEKTSLLQ